MADDGWLSTNKSAMEHTASEDAPKRLFFSTAVNIVPEPSDARIAENAFNETSVNDSGGISDGAIENGSTVVQRPDSSTGSPLTRRDATTATASSVEPAPERPSTEPSYASEIYISPAPSISLGCTARCEKDRPTPPRGAGRTDAPDAGTTSAYTDTKAALADRRSNFFSVVTRCPVLAPSPALAPIPASNSSVQNFQLAEPSKRNQRDGATGQQQRAVTANGHPEAVLDPARESAAPPSNDTRAASVYHRRTANGEPVVVIHQAAPPPDTAEIPPLTLSPAASGVLLLVDESLLLPQSCARVEPSPERFWGPSVAPLRSSCHNLQLHGADRNEARLGGSTGHLDALGNGRSGESCRLAASSSSSSAVPSPQESPLLKSVSKEPSSSTSTDSLPSTPSSATIISSHHKGCNLEKFRSFFGENAPKVVESKGEHLPAEPSPDAVAEEVILESKKVDLQKTPVTFDSGGKTSSSDRSFKNRKSGWSLSGKAHGTRSPGAKPKKTAERWGDSGDSQKPKETWKGKMARTILRYGSGPILASADASGHAETLGVIGVPLEYCSPSPFNELVPLLVSVCTHIVEEKGLLNQGIYRVPGNTGAINLLIEEMNKDPVGLCLESERWQDVNLVSSLLKLFFRKLPDSLITDELYDAVIDANRLDNSTRRMLKLKKLLHELPEHNFETFHVLAQHLSRVASHEPANKMDARNLAIMFGPTLVRPQDNNMVNMVKDMTDQCRIIESVILHGDWFFGSWDEDVNVPVDGDCDELLAPISGMNDELLAKAESLGKRSSVTF